MAKRGLAATVGLAVLLLLLVVQSASASTQAGNQCVGNEAAENFTILSTANAPGGPLPATMPVAGVITRWTFNAVPELPPGILNQTLKMFRPTGTPGQFQVIGESTPALIAPGSNSFSTRISVLAGDMIGSYGATFEGPVTLFCETSNPGDRVGIVSGNPPLGSVATSAEELAGLQNPITVTIEPDADNDGYGDETQDQCPQSATLQVACPVVSLNASSVVKKTLVKVLVTASSQASVVVKGSVKLGKGKSAKLSGGTQIVAPGVISRFILLFPGKLKAKLEELSKKRFLSLKLTVKGANLAGAPTVRTLKVKLKGQAKPKPRPKPKSPK
jgi:hypothetical protein